MSHPFMHCCMFIAKLDGRFVDTNLNIYTQLAAPEGDLFGDLTKYPVTDIDNHAGIFCNRNEFIRRNYTTDRMLPAYKRLGFGDLTTTQIDNRLVTQQKLLLVNRKV